MMIIYFKELDIAYWQFLEPKIWSLGFNFIRKNED